MQQSTDPEIRTASSDIELICAACDQQLFQMQEKVAGVCGSCQRLFDEDD